MIANPCPTSTRLNRTPRPNVFILLFLSASFVPWRSPNCDVGSGRITPPSGEISGENETTRAMRSSTTAFRSMFTSPTARRLDQLNGCPCFYTTNATTFDFGFRINFQPRCFCSFIALQFSPRRADSGFDYSLSDAFLIARPPSPWLRRGMVLSFRTSDATVCLSRARCAGRFSRRIVDCADRTIAIRQIEQKRCIPIKIEVVNARLRKRLKKPGRQTDARRRRRRRFAGPENSAEPASYFTEQLGSPCFRLE